MTRTSLAVAWAALTIALASPAIAGASETISSSGPIEGITVGDDLSCQVAYAGGDTYEFFPSQTSPGDCAAVVSVDGTLYAPDLEGHGVSAADSLSPDAFFTPVGERLRGSGSAVDPYVITTDVTAGDDIAVQMRTTYVVGQSAYRVELTVRNTSQDASHDVSIYYAGDCYASGSDVGHGFVRPEINSIGCSQMPNNNPAGRTIQMLPLSPGSAGFENFFDTVWARIGDQVDFDDSCRCEESLDNGVALQWKSSLRNLETAERSLQVAFTESQTPPMSDGDGDALPDAWETGQGAAGDAENLAVLGADPRRKDIFVQADWMDGCAPPAGWESRAIEMFAKRGIALHVDSGPGTMNVEGGADPNDASLRRPWGGRSRAGAVAYSDDVPRSALWSTVDQLKDAHFVPSGRRRAFHYVVFANKVTGVEGKGVSRGLPDSDVIIGNCRISGRASDTFFVHELGHNLGLHHGGNDDRSSKPNYYSVMNYGWAIAALTDERQFYSYSDQVQPALDERALDERKRLQTPLQWHCPWDKLNFPSTHLSHLGMTFGVVDLNCNGIYGESFVQSDLDKDGRLEIDTGFDDWSALQFGGGGIIGALTVPARGPANDIPEFGTDEIAGYRAAQAVARQRAAKQLTVVSKARQLTRPRKRKVGARIKLQVKTATGKAVRRASIRVKGGKIVGPKRRAKQRTAKKGRLTLRIRPAGKKKQLRITATRRGYRKGSLVVPVRKR